MKKIRGVKQIKAEQVAQAFVRGLSRDASEVLVGWQSHLAVWCDRLSPWLLERILQVTAPRSVAGGV